MNALKTIAVPAASKPARFFASLAIAGVATTIMLTAKAAPQAEKSLKETGDEESALKVKVEQTWKIYAPAATAAVITIFCILRSSQLSRIRSEALLTAFIIEPFVADN